MKTSFFSPDLLDACLFPEIKDDRGICFYDMSSKERRWILSSDYVVVWYMTHDMTAVLDA